MMAIAMETSTSRKSHGCEQRTAVIAFREAEAYEGLRSSSYSQCIATAPICATA